MEVGLSLILPFLLGGLTGLLLGLTGAGGGIMASPLLILVLHESVAQSAPIGLVSVFIGAGLGALMGLRQGLVRYRAALLLSLAGLVTSPFGVFLSRKIPNTMLISLFALLLLYQGWRYGQQLSVTQDHEFPCQMDGQTGRFRWNLTCFLTMLHMGSLTGFLSGLLGVGGGFVLVPALRRHTPLTTHSVTATSLMVLALVSLGGALQWLAMGQISWQIARPFLLGVVTGIIAGRSQMHRLAERHMRSIFSLLCFTAAGSLLIKVWSS